MLHRHSLNRLELIKRRLKYTRYGYSVLTGRELFWM